LRWERESGVDWERGKNRGRAYLRASRVEFGVVLAEGDRGREALAVFGESAARRHVWR